MSAPRVPENVPVLDASAFYAGVPFGSPDTYQTTPEIYREIRHIKGKQDAVGALVEAGKLRLVQPDPACAERAMEAAQKTGDLPTLSREDLSVLALAIQTGQGIITDDYAVSNVAGNVGIGIFPVMTSGVRNVGRWTYRCIPCNMTQEPAASCRVCGAPLTRRLRPGTSLGRG